MPNGEWPTVQGIVPYFPEYKLHFEHTKFTQKRGVATYTLTIKLTVTNRVDVCIRGKKWGGGTVYTPENMVSGNCDPRM